VVCWDDESEEAGCASVGKIFPMKYFVFDLFHGKS
jgi:hypothetical protein